MATYVERTLARDEAILERANFNWTYSAPAIFWCFIGITPAIFLIWLMIAAKLSFGDLMSAWWATSASAFFGILYILFHMIFLVTTEIVVTNYRFVYKTGLLTLNSKEVSLNKIEEITIHQSPFGRIFGYGKVVIRGTGVGVIELPDLDSPVRLRKIIEDARSVLRSGSASERAGNDD